LKDESDKSDIIVYDMHDDYSVGRSSKSKKTTDREEKKESPNPNQQYGDNDSTAHLGGLTGRVYDKLTYLTVKGALVTIAKGLSVKTDERGNFVVGNIKPGSYRVTVSEDGYIIQSRKSTVVAGETTKLESFHLIPACLAAEYPDAIAEEDEETGEEDLVGEETMEPSVAPPPLTSPEEITCAPTTGIAAKQEEAAVEEIVPEELSEETTRASSDVVIVKDVEGEIVPDSETRETVIEENPIEYSETDAGEEALSTLEETVEETAQEKTKEEVRQEELLKPPIEIAPETIIQEKIAQEVQEEEPSLDVSVEEAIEHPAVDENMHAMIIGSTEAVMTVPEERITEDVCSVDELPQISIETDIAEVTQPEEVLQGPSEEEARLKPLWRTWFKRKPKKEAHEEEALKPSVEAAPEVVIQEMAVDETHREGPSADTFISDETVSIPAEEIQISAIAVESTEAVISVAEKEIAVGEEPSVEELPSMSIEVEVTLPEEVLQEPSEEKAPIETNVEEMVQEETEEGVLQKGLLELSIEVASQIAPQGGVLEEVQRELSIDVSVSYEPFTMPPEETQTSAIAVDSTETAMTVPEETVVGGAPAIDELPDTSIETSIAEAIQPEKVPEVVLGETPQELSLEETPIETAAVEITEEKVQEEAYREPLLEPSAGEVAEESVPLVEHEKPAIEPSMVVAPKTTPQEITQPKEVREEVLQEPSEEQYQSKLQWWKLRKRKTKEAYQEQSLEPSAGGITEQSVPLVEHEEPAIEPSMEVALKTTPREMVLEEVLREKPSVDISLEEAIVQPVVDETMDEIITELAKQEVATATKITAAMEGGEEACETITVKKPIGYSESYIFAEDSVAPEEALEGISDDDIASVSEEERAAMSSDYDTVEVEGFIGVINAQPNPAFKGLPISIAYTLRNVACDDPDNFIVRITVTNPDMGTIHETFETPVKCRKGTFSIGGFVIFTTSYETCAYRLNMQAVSKKTKTAHPLAGIPLEIKSIY
jgi:hypothetical protein